MAKNLSQENQTKNHVESRESKSETLDTKFAKALKITPDSVDTDLDALFLSD